jgi:putative NADH-flavin reductase
VFDSDEAMRVAFKIVGIVRKELERARDEGKLSTSGRVASFQNGFEAGQAAERARVRELLDNFKHKGQTKNTFTDPHDAFHAGRRRGRNDVVRELLDALKDTK